MSQLAAPEPKGAVERLIAHWRAWWQHHNEFRNLSQSELDRVAAEFGLTAHDLEQLSAKGPHAADLLYQRMQALGIARADVERIANGLMRDLEKSCAGCHDKGQCRKDLAAHPDDPVWKDYCPNALSLDALSKMKGRFPI